MTNTKTKIPAPTKSPIIKAKEVLTYRPKENKVGFLEYTERTVHTEHGAMYRVKTATGHFIDATDDHSLATVGESEFFAPLPPQDSMGKFVPIIMRSNIYDSSCELDDLEYDPDNMITWPVEALYGMYKDQKELHFTKVEDVALTKLLLFKVGLYYEIKDEFTIIIDKDCFGYVPEDGKLVRREEARPTNMYRFMPFTWSPIVSVEEIVREATTYDFTVPEFPLFIGNDILVYDTMQVHVPSTEAGRQDALTKMLPSKNLFSVRNLEPMMVPQQEHTFGAYKSSKPSSAPMVKAKNTEEIKDLLDRGMIKPNNLVQMGNIKATAGNILINHCLPEELRDYNAVWTKGKLKSTLGTLGRSKPDLYTHAADNIKELGSQFVYQLGTSFKKDDFNLEDLKKKRDKMFDQVEATLKKIDAGKGTDQEKYKQKIDILRKAQSFAQGLTDNATDNNFHQWAYSGSRGSKSQVMQIISAPVIVADPKDRVIPTLIRKSFNEGLSPSDYWVSSYGTRKGTVGAKLSVQPSGALAKEIVGNVLDVVISQKDCGTKEGYAIPIEDAKDISERYEAGTNRFIDAKYYEELRKKGAKTVLVRSPMKCHAKHGVCQLCYGHNEKGHLPDIGDNIGVQCGHAVTEPLTQMGLGSKHTAGTAAEEKVGLDTIKQFFTMTDQYSGAAVIAGNSGIITNIAKAPAGGTNVWVDKKRYHIVPGMEHNLKVGDKVSAGDVLTKGLPNLSKITPHKGIDYSRELFVNTAHDLYNRAGAYSVRKNFETIARGLVNYVTIEDPGDLTHHIHGDVVDYNQLRVEIEELKKSHPTAVLPKFSPIQKGTTWAPQDKKDWMANFGFKYLKTNLIENAAMGVSSKVHGYHPVASYAVGNEFGDSSSGKY